MAWVRWSTNIKRGVSSDLYIYDSAHGYISVNVAGRKRVAIDMDVVPQPPTLDARHVSINAFLIAKRKHDAFWESGNEGKTFNWQYLNDEWACKSLEFTDVDELIETLNEMRKDGINFPDYVFEFAEESRKEYER